MQYVELPADLDGCWEWKGKKNKRGYGLYYRMWWRGIETQRFAHRCLYEDLIGPIPPGKVLDHFYCNNPSCVSPYHLEAVRPQENTIRYFASEAFREREIRRMSPSYKSPLDEANEDSVTLLFNNDPLDLTDDQLLRAIHELRRRRSEFASAEAAKSLAPKKPRAKAPTLDAVNAAGADVPTAEVNLDDLL